MSNWEDPDQTAALIHRLIWAFESHIKHKSFCIIVLSLIVTTDHVLSYLSSKLFECRSFGFIIPVSPFYVCLALRGMDTLSGEATLSELFVSLFKRGLL